MLRGHAVYEGRPTLDGIDEALTLVDRALQLDPRFVPALTLKAFMLMNRYDEQAQPNHDHHARELDELTAQAIALDPQDPNAWFTRTYALLVNGQWAAAMAAADKGLEIEQGAPSAWATKADTAIKLGRPEMALQWLQAEPVRSSNDSYVLLMTCQAQLLLGQLQAALSACERAVGIDPTWWFAHQYLAAIHANLGQAEQAKASLQVVERKSPGLTIDRLRNYCYHAHPDFRRLAEATYFAGLRRAGMPER